MKLSTLKQQKSTYLNYECDSLEQFEEIQNKLNIIETEILLRRLEG